MAALCYVDLCKAATYIRPNEDSVLHHIAADIDGDLREKIWTTDSSSTLTTDYLLTRLKLDTTTTLATLVPSCVAPDAPLRFKLALVKSCLFIMEEDSHLEWNPTMENMAPTVCPILRHLFIHGQDQVDLVIDLLSLYKLNPSLALLVSNPERAGICHSRPSFLALE
jgi:neurofibromin 1